MPVQMLKENHSLLLLTINKSIQYYLSYTCFTIHMYKCMNKNFNENYRPEATTIQAYTGFITGFYDLLGKLDPGTTIFDD